MGIPNPDLPKALNSGRFLKAWSESLHDSRNLT